VSSDGVMEKRGSEGGGTRRMSADVRDFEKVGEVRIAGAAALVVVGARWRNS